jgi:DNA-binding SARP family transcriptional activator
MQRALTWGEPVHRVAAVMDVLLLGPIDVVDSQGDRVKVPGTRPKALLALLALEIPNLVSTDVMIEELWGDSDIANRESTLHSTMNRLRQAVGSDVIQTEPGGYRLDIPEANTDLSRFHMHVRRGRQMQALGHPDQACESYRHALAQWRGPPLADLRRFEFAEQAARLLEEERLRAVESLMDAMLSDGSHEQVASELAGLVDEFPYRERLWELLMLSLYRSGRQAEALTAFQRIRVRLGEELGIEPWPALVDLEDRILLHDPALSEFVTARAELPAEVEFLQFRSGEVIVEEGATASAIYWIEEGEVEVIKCQGSQLERSVARLGPGQYFGELDTILGTARSSTVRAVVQTTVSVYDVNSFRTRILLSEGPRGDDLDSVEQIRDLVRRGHYLRAYDTASREIEHGEQGLEVRYLAVLALARSGATSQARRRYDQYGLNRLDRSSVPSGLGSDIAVLSARLDKDQALASTEMRKAWARRSAEGYEQTHDATREPYHGVNAATMWLLAGDKQKAQALAKKVLDELSGSDYWALATEAEAALLLGDLERTGEALVAAATAGPELLSQRATTLKQLKLICALTATSTSILEPIRNPPVIHYSGHRMIPAERDGAESGEESRVASEIRELIEALDVGVGFGSLAAGADIIAAEALLDRGAELNVVLPFDADDFVRTSVHPAGAEWVHRFERCMAGAASIELATHADFLGDPVLFDFGAQVAMGLTLMRARHLEAAPHQIAVWDGGEARGEAGTAVDVARWERTGAPSTVIDVSVTAVGDSAEVSPEVSRSIRAVVIADVAGYSDLSDRQLIAFHDAVSADMASRIAPHRKQLVSGRTWGNRMRLVFEDVPAAAQCALDLMEGAKQFNADSAGLGELRGLRIAAHASPVFQHADPIFGSSLMFGIGLGEAAVIEPRTPAGEIYTTRAFAALAVLSGQDDFECQYVGTMPAARRYGHVPLYVLRRGAGPGPSFVSEM